MFYNPIEQRKFKTNIVPRFFALDPFMPQNFKNSLYNVEFLTNSVASSSGGSICCWAHFWIVNQVRPVKFLSERPTAHSNRKDVMIFMFGGN
jgi:hypothetical protein